MRSSKDPCDRAAQSDPHRPTSWPLPPLCSCARRWTPISSSSMLFSLATLWLTPAQHSKAARPALVWINFGSFLAQFALTFAYIFPVKDRLKEQEKRGEPYDDVKIRRNISAWERLHRLRILGSALAFGASLLELMGYVAAL